MPGLDDRRSVSLWDQSYRGLSQTSLWSDPPVPFVDEALAVFKSTQAHIVLDMPSGDGRNSVPMAIRRPVLVAADASATALARAQHKLSVAGRRNVVLVEANIFSLPFPEKSFDGIFCWDLLGHLSDARGALTELVYRLRPGAFLFANVFSMNDSTLASQNEQIGDNEYLFDNRFYFQYYDRAGVQRLTEGLPTSVDQIKTVRWSEPPHEGYREYPHEHESWVFGLRKDPT